MKKAIFILLFLFFPSMVIAAAEDDIVINEIKIGSDGASTDEFVELYNRTDADIDLAGWALKKKTQSGSESNLVSASKSSGRIPARGFFLIAHPDYKGSVKPDMSYSGSSYSISANNTVLLYDAAGNLIDEAGYGEASVFEGKAAVSVDNNQSLLRRMIDGEPVDTNDNFNDFILSNSPDPQNSANQKQAAGSSEAVPVDQTAETTLAPETTPAKISDNVVISEIFSNPYLSDDTGEFIELYNKGDEMIDLSGWRLADESGRQFIIPHGERIYAYKFYVVYRPESGIILENDADTVKLFAPGQSKPKEIVKYKDAPESMSYSRDMSDLKRWVWTYHITPMGINIVEPENKAPEISLDMPDEAMAGEGIIFDSSDTSDPENDLLAFMWDFGDGATSSLETAEHIYWTNGSYKIILTVSDGKNEAKKEGKLKITGGRESVKKTATGKATSTKKISQKASSSGRVLSGTVVSLPGQFGVQYFYALAPTAVQVYSYKKDFPELSIGDKIEVSGSLSTYNGLPRVKITDAENIDIVENGEAPMAEQKNCTNINKDAAGRLVAITGVVADKKGQSIYIDDASGEAEVYVKKGTNISMTNFIEGATTTVVGLVMPYKDHYQLWPRSVEDVKLDDQGKVLGESASSGEWSLAARENNNEWMKYALVLLGGMIVVLGGVIFKQHQKQSTDIKREGVMFNIEE